MTSIIAGAAGHVDHGKTALVRALTGIDTDRLEEEKRRGISIDLGFAHMPLGGGVDLSFIDVPGHERFIKNMLAGAGGIDLVVLVVAANESVMPQTREHLDICRMLGIQRGMVALTKADLVTADWLELVRQDVASLVEGTFLEAAPVVAVSARTGEGLAALRETLRTIAAEVQSRDASRPFRLWIDRVFARKGFGTVVTGTTVGGQIRVGDEVALQPGGRAARVRGIQVHGEAAERAQAGQRTALNLAGIEVAEAARGMTAVRHGELEPTSRIDARFELLPNAADFKTGARVHFHAGSAEVLGTVRLIGGAPSLAPGGAAFARIQLSAPLLLVPGDRFVCRSYSPMHTIGGGLVLDAHPPDRLKSSARAERMRVLASGDPAAELALFVSESETGLSVSAALARTGWSAGELERVARDAKMLIGAPHSWLLLGSQRQRLVAAIQSILTEFHRQESLAAGMPRETLRTRALASGPPFLLDFLATPESGYVIEGEVARLTTHQPRLHEQEDRAAAAIERAFQSAGLAVPALADVLNGSGLDPSRSRAILQMLLKQRRLVRVAADLVFHAEAIQQLRQLLASRKGTVFRVGDFKEWTGISRKYAIPLLEFLDRERVTLREGDARRIL